MNSAIAHTNYYGKQETPSLHTSIACQWI